MGVGPSDALRAHTITSPRGPSHPSWRPKLDQNALSTQRLSGMSGDDPGMSGDDPGMTRGCPGMSGYCPGMVPGSSPGHPRVIPGSSPGNPCSDHPSKPLKSAKDNNAFWSSFGLHGIRDGRRGEAMVWALRTHPHRIITTSVANAVEEKRLVRCTNIA